MYLLPLCFHCFCVLCILQVCRSCQFLVRLGWWLWPLLLVGSRDWGRWSTGRAGGLDGSNTGLWRPLDYRNWVNSWWSFDGTVFQSGGPLLFWVVADVCLIYCSFFWYFVHILCIFADRPEAVQTIYVPQLHAVLLWETGCVSCSDCNVATDYSLQYSDEL